MSDCIFCQIADGGIPATLVRESDRFVAFRDLHPQAPTHVLVIPRTHVASLNDVSEPDLVGELLLFARDVAGAEGLADRGYRVVLNTNAEGGQTVFHLHAHVVGGRPMGWPPG